MSSSSHYSIRTIYRRLRTAIEFCVSGTAGLSRMGGKGRFRIVDVEGSGKSCVPLGKDTSTHPGLGLCNDNRNKCFAPIARQEPLT